MNKQYIPFGDAMGMKVAFSDLVAVDITESVKMVWVSGQVAFDEKGDIIGKGDIGVQTEQCIKKIANALEKMGGTLDDVVKVTVFVKEMDRLEEIHKIRLKYFKEPYPASTLVQITDFVSPDILIEIEATAVIKNNQ